MKEAMGNSAILMIVITFMAIFILILTSSSAYSKAAKVRNRLVEMIEYNQGYIDEGNAADFRDQIEIELAKYGYRQNTASGNTCKSRPGNAETLFDAIPAINTEFSKYKYCIYKYRTSKGVYYGVETYMYFDIPLVDQLPPIGIYGETKTLYDLSEF